jgi:acetamidase/formamidase
MGGLDGAVSPIAGPAYDAILALGCAEVAGQQAALPKRRGVPRDDVYMLLSTARDLQVTWNVDITKGIHAVHPRSAAQSGLSEVR